MKTLPHHLAGIVLVCLMTVFSFAAPGAQRSARNEVTSLDGQWSFELDPKDIGRTENWFARTTSFPNTIQVPGAWQAQGYGTENDKLRHHYDGQAWYRRTIHVPKFAASQRFFLCFGGVHRSAEVWVNGAQLGSHIGYLSPFEFDLTPLVSPESDATITVCVDSRQDWNRDCLTGCIDIIDAMFTSWGGISGHVWTETRNAAWFDDVFVQPRVNPAACTVSAAIRGDSSSADCMSVKILASNGRIVGDVTTAFGGIRTPLTELRFDVNVPGAQLWSPETPTLYTARLTLLSGQKVLDQKDVPFGFRSIEIRSRNFLLNGKKIFLRGYGDDAIYPKTMAPPVDKAFYVERLKEAKRYGFNYVRHHSHMLPPEYFTAADEVGILVSAEFPIAYQEYYNKAKGPALDLYKAEWAAVIKELRNHPSIFNWCMGNELYWSIPIAPELYRTAKALDGTRPVNDTDGLPMDGYLDGRVNRATLDFCSVQFDEFALPPDNPNKHRVYSPIEKPCISHETGNYITMPHLDQIGLFKQNFKPFWLDAYAATMKKLRLANEAELWSRNSERLYRLSHKLNLEDLRKNPNLSGYTWWLLQDYWTGSNGLLDSYFRRKGISPDEVLPFNSAVVLLQDGLALTYESGQLLDLKFLVSNFSPAEIQHGTLNVRIKSGSARLAANNFSAIHADQGDVSEAAWMKAALPRVSQPTRIMVEVELRDGATSWRNDWQSWVFPKNPAPEINVPVYASDAVAGHLAKLGLRPLAIGTNTLRSAVYVVRELTPQLLKTMESGASVVCLSPQDVFQARANRFKPAWWLGNKDTDVNAGTVVYDNPVTRQFAPEGWCDVAWYRLLEGAKAYELDGFPSKPQTMVRALDVHTCCRNKALLFEAQVGQGTLIVCGLKLDCDTPESRWLLSRLIAHAATFPKPKQQLAGGYLSDLLGQSALPAGPFVPGFSGLHSTNIEQTRYQSYRRTDETILVCRQTEAGGSLSWQTARVPAGSTGGTVTFLFAGGLGWRSQPEVGGFELQVNDRDSVRFDVTRTSQTWSNQDGSIQLTFKPRLPMNEDAMGLFFLTVPQKSLVPGKSCRLTVRSIGTGSKRWFGLNPVADVKLD